MRGAAPAGDVYDPARLPRPNLGPEPWPTPSLPLGALAILALATLAIGVALWFLLRRRKRRAAPAEALAKGIDQEPREQILILWERALRSALVARFGPAWAAKTTEEIAADGELAALLGPERRERLVRLLSLADRAKFAAGPAEPPQGEDWEGWVEALLADLAPSAGARSRING